jgi:magnesium transporter
MDAECHELGSDGSFTPLSLDQAIASNEAGRKVWIDLTEPDRRSLKGLLARLGVSSFLTQRCLEAGTTTAVVATPKGTFADLMVFADRSCSRRARVAVLAVEGLLLTMKSAPIDEPVSIREAVEGVNTDQMTTSKLLYAVFLEHATITGVNARRLRERIIEVGDRMDEDVQSVDSQELEDLVREILLGLAVADEQEEAFELLADASSAGFVTEGLAPRLSLLKTTASGTSRLLRRLDDRGENLLRRYQDYKQELINRRLARLTIISAVFMPLTLLAGIWGMNFENMPELSHPYAYPSALLLMVTIASSTAWFLYKRGWFD